MRIASVVVGIETISGVGIRPYETCTYIGQNASLVLRHTGIAHLAEVFDIQLCAVVAIVVPIGNNLVRGALLLRHFASNILLVEWTNRVRAEVVAIATHLLAYQYACDFSDTAWHALTTTTPGRFRIHKHIYRLSVFIFEKRCPTITNLLRICLLIQETSQHYSLINICVGTLLIHKLYIGKSHISIQICICQLFDTLNFRLERHARLAGYDILGLHTRNGISLGVILAHYGTTRKVDLHLVGTMKFVVVDTLEHKAETILAILALQVVGATIGTKVYQVISNIFVACHILRTEVANNHSDKLSACEQNTLCVGLGTNLLETLCRNG